ncbi:hypothetical protein [Nocardia sp. NPDC004750]
MAVTDLDEARALPERAVLSTLAHAGGPKKRCVPFSLCWKRGIVVGRKTRAEITGCTDLDRLESWTRKAATAESENDLFG